LKFILSLHGLWGISPTELEGAVTNAYTPSISSDKPPGSSPKVSSPLIGGDFALFYF